MHDPVERSVSEQRVAYRRGVVLGLTMAEVGILIIFVLLLLIGFNEWVRTKNAAAEKGMERIPSANLAALKSAEAHLTELKQELGARPDATPAEIKTMVRALKNAQTPEGKTMLQAVQNALGDLQKAGDRVARGDVTVGQVVKDQALESANQKGQVNYWKGQYEGVAGKGGTSETPCWVREDGTIEFLYDVVLGSDGIRMREYRYQHRDGARAGLPMPVVDPKESLSRGEFLRRTLPLYQSSLAKNCRFFVVIFDATGPTEKELYKALLLTVEGHFYKRLDHGPAPF